MDPNVRRDDGLKVSESSMLPDPCALKTVIPTKVGTHAELTDTALE